MMGQCVKTLLPFLEFRDTNTTGVKHDTKKFFLRNNSELHHETEFVGGAGDQFPRQSTVDAQYQR